MPSYQRFRVAIRLGSAPQSPRTLAEALVWHGAVEPAVRAGQVEFRVDVPSSQGAEAVAARRAVSLLASAQNEAGELRTRIRSLWVGEPASRDPDPPGGVPLAGVAEVARALGVSRQRVSQLARAGPLPAPLAELASGPVWSVHDVEAFASTWDRTPGRRPSRGDR